MGPSELPISGIVDGPEWLYLSKETAHAQEFEWGKQSRNGPERNVGARIAVALFGFRTCLSLTRMYRKIKLIILLCSNIGRLSLRARFTEPDAISHLAFSSVARPVALGENGTITGDHAESAVSLIRDKC